MDSEDPIKSVPAFVQKIGEDAALWKPVFPFFRGERDVDFPTLLPHVFRESYDENNLLQSFRRRAHLLDLPVVPPRDAIDQWLFLARHVNLPTRLLDWTEGSLIALYFALCGVERYERQEGQDATQTKAVVWMLQPMRFNQLVAEFEKQFRSKTLGPGQPSQEPQAAEDEARANYYGLTWFDRDPVFDPEKNKWIKKINIAHENIACAWELGRHGERGTQLPVAVEPTSIHPRMYAQHSYFTVHGRDERPLHTLLSEALEQLREAGRCDYQLADVLRRYEVDIEPSAGMAELRTLGIADSTIMPDADSLAKELSRFMRGS